MALPRRQRPAKARLTGATRAGVVARLALLLALLGLSLMVVGELADLGRLPPWQGPWGSVSGAAAAPPRR